MSHVPDLGEHGSRSARCTHCGKRGRAKCKAGVCLNFCCMTKKMNETPSEMKPSKNYILTIPVRGTQTVLVPASSAKEAREKYEAGRGEFQRTDLSIDWTGVPRIILDGGWRKKKGEAK